MNGTKANEQTNI